MSQLIACRMCLADNIRLYNIRHTIYEEVFEKLTSLVMCTDGKPVLACSLCKAQLKKCLQLKEMCLRADSVLSLMAFSQFGLNNAALRMIDRTCYKLSSGMLSLCPEVHQEKLLSEENDVTIKQEVCVPAEITENEFKSDKDVDTQQVNEENAVVEFELEMNDDHIQFSDGDEDMDIPLNKVKLTIKCNDDEEEMMKPMKIVRKKEPKTKIKSSTRKSKVIKKDVIEEGIKKEKKPKWVRTKELVPHFSCDYAREVILSQEEQLKELNDRLTSSNYKISIYKCEFCYRGYSDGRAYDNHMLSHDEKTGPHQCEICKIRYPKKTLLNAHMSRQHVRRYLCNICPFQSQTPHKAKMHYLEHNGHLYPCEKCDKKFKKLSNYHQHLRGMHSTEFVCTKCGECLASDRGLNVHLVRVHRDQPEESLDEPKEDRLCTECDIQFDSVFAWQRHVLTSKKHKEAIENDSTCPICHVAYGTTEPKMHLRNHIRELRCNRSVTCNECGKAYATVRVLVEHMKRRHMNIKIPNQKRNSNSKSSASNECKRYVCELCGNAYYDSFRLRAHLRSHSGEKPFSCGQCGKALASKLSLVCHLRTHTGEKPYVCSTCGLKFAHPSALTTHKRVHTGARPYKCPHCQKAFTQSASVALHVRTVHMKLPSKYKRSANRRRNLIVPTE